ncbi:RstR phage-related transcriptional repressor [Pseudomonas sp. R2-37-08W]|nr:RstR phage-related transcriptional repressor [Pseudomonas sp. R2-37-08W]
MRVGFNHHINRLANRVLIDVFDINLQAIDGFDHDAAFCNHLRLRYQFEAISRMPMEEQELGRGLFDAVIANTR